MSEAASEIQIWNVEEEMEIGFVDVITAAMEESYPVYRSRLNVDAQTPFIEIAFMVGAVNPRHEKLLSDGISRVYDTWSASVLQAIIKTHRQNNGSQHAPLLAQVRKACQRYKLAGTNGQYTKELTWTRPYHAVTDIREEGTTYAVDDLPDGNNIDISTMNFTVTHNIRNSAWPSNLP